jgi:flagellar motor switch protein FliN
MSEADTHDPDAPGPVSGQQAGTAAGGAAGRAAAGTSAAEPHEEQDKSGKQGRAGGFLGVPIEVTISVGKAKPLVSELVELKRDSVLALNSSIDDPVELYIGDRLIARGELQELGDSSGRLGVRLTEVADFQNDI